MNEKTAVPLESILRALNDARDNLQPEKLHVLCIVAGNLNFLEKTNIVYEQSQGFYERH